MIMKPFDLMKNQRAKFDTYSNPDQSIGLKFGTLFPNDTMSKRIKVKSFTFINIGV